MKRGVRVRCNCIIFNLAMENVLKGLPDKISCPDIIHKCTSNVHIFFNHFQIARHRHLFHSKNICPLLFRQALVSFKKYMPPPLQTGTCFIQKIYVPSSSGRGRGGGIYFLNGTSACVARSWR